MKDTAYTFAVAKVRAVETRLLSSSDMEQLIGASDYENAVKLLKDKGIVGEKDDVQTALKNLMTQTWHLLNEISPETSSLEILIVRNDFHNLKSALKSMVSTNRCEDHFIIPSVVKPELLKSAVSGKKFYELPDFLEVTAEKAYELLVRTMDGQLADILIDAATLDNLLKRAENSGNAYIQRFAELIAVTANIKTAYRAARTGKDETFLQAALCDTKELSKSALIQAAKKGPEELLAYLAETSYKDAAKYIRVSVSAFEKWCDDTIMSHIESAKYKSFGVEPLIAYYIAIETQVKTLRIILSCKYNNLQADIIRERVRKLYV